MQYAQARQDAGKSENVPRHEVLPLRRNGRFFPPTYLHESRLGYLYWDTGLEPKQGFRF